MSASWNGASLQPSRPAPAPPVNNGSYGYGSSVPMSHSSSNNSGGGSGSSIGAQRPINGNASMTYNGSGPSSRRGASGVTLLCTHPLTLVLSMTDSSANGNILSRSLQGMHMNSNGGGSSATLVGSSNSNSRYAPSTTSSYNTAYTNQSNSPFHAGNTSNGSIGSNKDYIREGPVQIKEEGVLAMFFTKKHAVLRDLALTFHKNKEVRVTRILSLNRALSLIQGVSHRPLARLQASSSSVMSKPSVVRT